MANESIESGIHILSFKKKTLAFVNESALRDLVSSGILKSYRLTYSIEETEVELEFEITPHQARKPDHWLLLERVE